MRTGHGETEEADRQVDARRAIVFSGIGAGIDRFGFSLERVAGSHHIYVHPDANRPVSIQPDGKEAKRYQLRQLRDMIEEFNLLDDE